MGFLVDTNIMMSNLSKLKSLLCVCIIIVSINCNNGFNIDLDNRVTHRSTQQGSMFGFTVAMYKYGNSNTLLVGAPKYQTDQPGVWNGGAVLSCSPELSNEPCSYVPFDIAGNSVHNLGFAVDNKTNQFFGATLKTSKEQGIVVACAPNYIWFTDSVKRREPVGTCYVARKELTDFQEFSPCRTVKWGYHRQGSCQAGFDAAITSNGERMFIGAPGAYYWQGQIHSQNLVTRNEYFTTGEGPAIEDDQYMGYSVSSGDFNGDGIQDMALGVPKGLNYTGKISLFTHDLNWIQNITGEQLGSYFGYCLTVFDFNNDDLDDILVGAPLYADFEDREMKIEVGKVYVFLQNSAHRFRHSVQYTGTITKGRFGLSVASLGDINYDSYGDFAVGEPYGGLNGKGAVYIFHGSDTTRDLRQDMKKPVQIIYAEEVSAGFTFGWSLSGAVDTDNNQYPDLLIGAYESEQAFLLKSRPIIKFTHHKLSFGSKGKTIDITTTNCKIRSQDFTCMDLEFCLTYDGINVDRAIQLNLKYHLDTKQKTEQRMFFKSNDLNFLEQTVSFRKDRKNCQKHVTYVKRGIVDKLTPITANVSYTLVKPSRPPRSLTPVLNQDSTLSRQDSLTIQKNCGPDNVCVPDLVLTFDAPDEFHIGAMDQVNVSVGVINNGEDAFEAAIFISEPKGLTFKKFEPQEQTSCSTRRIGGEAFVKCDIGNPLATKQKVNFNVIFQQFGDLEDEFFELVVTANSTNEEAPLSAANNMVKKTIQAKIDAEVSLYGTSDPEILIYNTTLYQVPIRLHENHFGPSLIHKYGLVNKGPAVVENAEIYILWPTKTISGRYLLYLMEQPITSGNIKCDKLTHLNPYNLELISDEEKASAIGIASLDSTNRVSDDYSEVTVDEIDSSSTVDSSSSGGTSYSSGGTSYSAGTSYSSGTGGTSYSSGTGGTSYSSGTRGTSHSSGTGGTGSTSYSSGRYVPSREGTSNRGYTYTSRTSSSSSRDGTSSGGTSGLIGSDDDDYTLTDSTRRIYTTSPGGSRGSSSGTRTNYSSESSGSRHSLGGSPGTSYSSDSGGSSGTMHSSGGSSGATYSSGGSSGATYSSGGSSGSRHSSGLAGATYSSGSRHSAGSEDDFANILNVGRQGDFSSTLYSPSISGGGDGVSSQGRSEDSSSGSYGASSSGRSGESSSSGGGRGYGVSSRGTFDESSSSGVSSSSSTGYGGSSQGRFDESSSSGGGRGHHHYSSTVTTGDGKTTHYSSQDGDRRRTKGDEEFNGDSRSGVDVRDESYYSSSSFGSDNRPSEAVDGGDGGGHVSSRGGSYYSLSSSSSPHSSSSSKTYQHKSSSSSSSSSDVYRPNEIPLRRKRRDAHDEFAEIVKQCNNNICTRIKCHTGRLEKNEDVYIYIRSRLFVDTLKEDEMFVYPVDNLQITTKMVTKSHIKDYGVQKEFIKVSSKNVTTPIRSAKSLAHAPPIPWWVILLATIAGILILLLIIIILWKFGFFKRHQKTSS